MPWPTIFPSAGPSKAAVRGNTARSAAPPLTIRNLTATPLELKLIERFEAPTEPGNNISIAQTTGNIFKNVTKAVTGNQTTTAGPGLQLPADLESFAHQDTNILCDPFKTQHTDVSTVERGERDVVRLTFEADGQRYKIDVPGNSSRSQVLQPVGEAKLEMTGVFVPEQSWLTLYSSGDLNCWMRHLKDNTPLSALSIPGTHNSPTCYRALPSVRCQAVSPRQQLDNGVRFFDVRVQPESVKSDKLILVHSVFPISVTGSKNFRAELLPQIYQFLDANPSETLIMSLKREGTGRAEDGINDELLSKILLDHYTTGEDAHRWYTDPRIPSLGQARGKIVVMRRFGLHEDVKQAGRQAYGSHADLGEWAIDASRWADNTPHDLQRQICVQDFYEVLETQNIELKRKYVCEQLARSASLNCNFEDASVQRPPFYMNFLTASNFFNVGCWPERIAAKLNPAVTKYLAMEHGREMDEGRDVDACTGIVVTDWCGLDGDWDLIRCVVGCNARLMSKEGMH